MTRPVLIRCLLVGTFLLLGCGNTPTGFPGEFAKAVCAKAYSCCTPEDLQTTAGGTGYWGLNEEQCRTNITRWLTSDMALTNRALSANRIGWSEVKAGECIHEIETTSCEDLNAYPFGRLPACSAVRSAKVELGGSCCRSYECTSGRCQEDCVEGAGDLGYCAVPLAHKGEGEQCANTVYCLAGLYCHPATQQCTPRSSDGALCVTNVECQSGNCVGPDWDAGTPAVCAPVTLQPAPRCAPPSPVL